MSWDSLKPPNNLLWKVSFCQVLTRSPSSDTRERQMEACKEASRSAEDRKHCQAFRRDPYRGPDKGGQRPGNHTFLKFSLYSLKNVIFFIYNIAEIKLKGTYYYLLSQKGDFLIPVYMFYTHLAGVAATVGYLLESTTGFHLLLHSLSCWAYCLSTRALSWKHATMSLQAWKASSVRFTVR